MGIAKYKILRQLHDESSCWLSHRNYDPYLLGGEPLSIGTRNAIEKNRSK